ncbi:hypothetical protein [Methylomonas koyamae]|uniref:hypothetical protein n=1 Tax=Methylomonas koyamae TaxID=702114 RepID=UPI0011263B8E|nr:hypothetical protein [Methylomonas koyamae]TPQ26078.1 hypothetical protein C2U68_13105 [Methylomonas koyamae]
MLTSLRIWPNLLCLLAGIVFGFPLIHAPLNHPVSRMASANPAYRELSQNAFMVMSNRIELSRGRLVRYTDAAGQLQITRIQGMPGDQVGFAGQTLTVNAQPVAVYPQLRMAQGSLIVPQDAVFCFPDIAADIGGNERNLQQYLIPANVLDGSVLYVLNNNSTAAANPEFFGYGYGLLLAYLIVFLALARNKDRLHPAVYYPVRWVVGLNLLVWVLLAGYGIYVGLSGIVPSIYFIFLSALAYLGLSAVAASTSALAVGLLALLVIFADKPILGQAGPNS